MNHKGKATSITRGLVVVHKVSMIGRGVLEVNIINKTQPKRSTNNTINNSIKNRKRNISIGRAIILKVQIHHIEVKGMCILVNPFLMTGLSILNKNLQRIADEKRREEEEIFRRYKAQEWQRQQSNLQKRHQPKRQHGFETKSNSAQYPVRRAPKQ
eukprot:TRINITY_DN4857_c0_g1_i6.p4 TRINITY_DN4857_c0_g1~~TRINITY_DN4857_c0_g1_i6.p4  ORF type:complete len:156 (-),score=7.75 TRINITY_DN4857_c0_g1_i6:751-1218(-)